MNRLLDVLKRYYWVFLLLMIFTAAWYLRYIPGTKFTYPQMLEIDTHFFLRMAENIIEHGEVPASDTMAAFNTIPGGPNRQLDYMIVIWFYPMFYYLLNPMFGWSMYWVGVWVPAFVGALQVFFMYFLGKEIFNNKKIGLLSAAFLAFTPGILYRVSAGFMEKEPPTGLFMIIALYFFVRSVKAQDVTKDFTWRRLLIHPLALIEKLKLEPEKIKFGKSMAYAVLSGVFFALMAGSSGMIRIPILMIGIAVVASLLLNKHVKTLLWSYPVMFFSYFILSRAFAVSPDFASQDTVMSLIAIGLLAIRYAVGRFKLVKESYIPVVIPALIIIALILAGIVSYMFVDVGTWVSISIERISNPLSVGVVSSTVAEGQTVGDFVRGSTISFGNEYAINVYQLPQPLIYLSAIYFAVLGGALLFYEFIFRKKGFEYLMLGVLFFTFLVLAIGAARLAFMFAFPAAITAAYFICRSGHFVLKYGSKYFKGQWYTGLKIAGLALVMLIVVTNALSAYVMAQNITSSLTDDWKEAFYWIRDNTPEDSIVLEWWDFGWWFQYIAKRATLMDGGFHDEPPIRDVAKFYTEPFVDGDSPYSGLNFIKNYSIDYVMVSSDLVPKFGAMSKIANWGEKIDVLPVFNLAKNYQEGDRYLLEYGGADQSILVAYTATQTENETTLENITAVVKMPQGQAYIKNVAIGGRIISTNRSNAIPGTVYFAGNAVLFLPEAVQDCVFVRLYLYDGAGLENYFEKVYDNLGMKIYKVKYENFPENVTGQYVNVKYRE